MPVVAVAGVVGIVFAGRLGRTTGTPAAYSDLVVKKCPPGAPDGCHELMAKSFDLAADLLPSVPESVQGLRYQEGVVVLSKSGKAPVAAFTYTSPDGTTFHLEVSPHAAPTRDDRPIGTTPHGRTFRISPVQITTARVFNDEYLVYLLYYAPSRSPRVAGAHRVLADRLVDAVHPVTRQVNPPPKQ
jgi:hypothetical protein